MCGRTDSIDDRRYIIETTSHSDEIVQLRAGSTLDQSPDDESYGIDNVNVWIR